MSIGAIVGTAAAVVAVWTALDPWPVIGWETPNQHNADYGTTGEELKNFRDEWKCDEYDEELLEMREKLIRAQATGTDTAELEHMIDKIKEKMEKLDCSRFEDFG